MLVVELVVVDWLLGIKQLRSQAGVVLGDVMPTENGQYSFVPHPVQGFLSAQMLRAIADALDKLGK
jgi:hypothetical protein